MLHACHPLASITFDIKLSVAWSPSHGTHINSNVDFATLNVWVLGTHIWFLYMLCLVAYNTINLMVCETKIPVQSCRAWPVKVHDAINSMAG